MSHVASSVYTQAIERLHHDHGFDLVAVGLAEGPGAPLRWVHAYGSISDQLQRIALSPGRGVGGIVLKTAQPMLFTDIDQQMDPREYASYPILFAEKLRSLCALPLFDKTMVEGVLLCAFRNADATNDAVFGGFIEALEGTFCGFTVPTSDVREALYQPDRAERFAKPDIEDLLEAAVAAPISRTVDPYKELSPKELEVFVLLARGFTNKEIAHQLALSVKTVETHRSKIYRKLRIVSRAQLVNYAIRHQLLGF